MQIKYKNIECKTIMIQCPLSVLQDHVFGFETYLSCHDPNDNTPHVTHTCAAGGGLTICCGGAEQNKTSRREIQKREKMKKQSDGSEIKTEERRVNREEGRDNLCPEGCLTLTIYLRTDKCLSVFTSPFLQKHATEGKTGMHTEKH